MTIDTPASGETDLVRRLQDVNAQIWCAGDDTRNGRVKTLLNEAAECITRLSAGRDAVIEERNWFKRGLEVISSRLNFADPFSIADKFLSGRLKSSPAAPPSETELVTAAIRAGCTAADVHLMCSYPECGCKQIPNAIKAALTVSKTEE